MHLIKALLELLHLERQQSRELAEIRREHYALHKENLAEARQIKEQLAEIRLIGGEILLVSQLIKEIHLAVIHELVASIQISTETGDEMEIKVGQTSTLSAKFLGASGNPTVPVGTPTLNSTDTTNFSLDPASAVITANGAAGSTTDVTLSVDGVTSNAVTYTIVEDVPPVEPVASIELTGSTPA